MCLPVFGAAQTKVGQNVINNTPIGVGYKAINNEKLSDDVRNGTAYTGMANAFAINKLKKMDNQYSTAGM